MSNITKTEESLACIAAQLQDLTNILEQLLMLLDGKL